MYKSAVKKLLILILTAATLFITSCKHVDKEQQELISTYINDFVFELARYSVTGECDLKNPEKYNFPKEFDKYTLRSYYENGQKYYLIEQYFPHKKGVLESSGFYNPYVDDASWVDDLLIQIEEERIAQEISQMEEEFQSNSYEPSVFEPDSADKEKSEVVAITGKDEKLRFMEFNKEIYIPQNYEDEFISIEVSESNVVRNFFDNEYKMYKKETWKITDVSNSSLIETEEYKFRDGEYRPYEKSVRSQTDCEVVGYTEWGEVTYINKYKVVERKPAKEKKETKEAAEKETVKEPVKEDVLVSEYLWVFDEEGYITEQKCTEYHYNTDFTKLDYTFEKKYNYVYNDFSDELSEEDAEKIPADFEYFENDQLKMKNKYSSELGTYTSQVFFDNDFSVKTWYKKYVREKDVYTEGNVVKRVKEYE